MPLLFDQKSFEIVEFEENGGNSYFTLKSSVSEDEITFDYIPKVDTSLNSSEYEVFLLVNNHLNAENDVFILKDRFINREKDNGKDQDGNEKPKGGHEDTIIGWVFPITVLESNESEHSENSFLNKYRYVAFKNLLEGNVNIAPAQIEFQQSGKYLLSDIYGEDVILAVLSKSNVSKLNSFNFYNYIPGLSKQGYFLKNEYDFAHHLDEMKSSCVERRGKKYLTLQQTILPFEDSEQFIYDLYTQYFKNISNELLRFHLQYQVVEHLITQRFDDDFKKTITEFENLKIQKNDFIEQINELKNERNNIRNIFSSYEENCPTARSHTADLRRDCIDLLTNYTNFKKTTIGDLVYDTRNLLVHNYRKLTPSDKDRLTQLSINFELVISDLITLDIK